MWRLCSHLPRLRCLGFRVTLTDEFLLFAVQPVTLPAEGDEAARLRHHGGRVLVHALGGLAAASHVVLFFVAHRWGKFHLKNNYHHN